jgi:NAD(P)-dependent dehydrogenase (short-subunit alcohol dehydrogenase family)
MTQQDSPVWFITGCSTGFGRELAASVLARGWRVVATARDATRVQDLVADHAEDALALSLDVTRTEQVASAVAAAERRFGTIDVLVNNAGYGYQASIEEGEDAEIRAMFEANVFGLAAMTRAVLPGMRSRRGAIVNISSVAGFIGFPGSGYYAATKHAVEGLSSALAKEVGPLGIKVLCIEPGPFRTDFAGRSLRQTEGRIADYADSVAARMRATVAVSGEQAGDPARAADAIISAVQAPNTPEHLVLGRFGIEAVTKQLRTTLDEIEAWKQVGLDTDFPERRGG